MAITWNSSGFNDRIAETKTSWKPAKKFWFDGALDYRTGLVYAVDSNGQIYPWPDHKKKMLPGETVSLWKLVGFKKKTFGNGLGVLPVKTQYLAEWDPKGNWALVNGSVTDQDYAAASKKMKKGKQYPKNKGDSGSSEPAKQDAQFINTEGWAVKANAPMLSVNYPDDGFLALQTDDSIPEIDRTPDHKKSRQDRKLAKVHGNAKGLALKGAKGKKGDKIADHFKNQKNTKPNKVKTVLNDPTALMPSNKIRLGYIEQDLLLHSDLASTQGIQTKQKQKKQQKSTNDVKPHRWRFKFHYNPATVNVSQSYSTDMDPLFVKKDPAAAIQSGSSVSFTLYLNRIEEMQILNHDGGWRQGTGDTSNFDADYAKWAWRGQVDQATRSVIRNQGTLYDLEYLYRVANGEPLETWKGPSADYGILFGQPLRLHFTSLTYNGFPVGMSYYGFISSISMDHKMFSVDMVPSLTEVQISFTRIPDTLANDQPGLSQAFAT